LLEKNASAIQVFCTYLNNIAVSPGKSNPTLLKYKTLRMKKEQWIMRIDRISEPNSVRQKKEGSKTTSLSLSYSYKY